jgi:hypothetical protein
MEPTASDCDHGLVTSDSAVGQPEPDLLYDAPYIVFIYAAWVGAAYLLGDALGLTILVATTVLFTTAALRSPARPHVPRSFAADFAVILLFCAASIGIGVFLVAAASQQPALTVGMALLGAAAVLGHRALQPTAA